MKRRGFLKTALASAAGLSATPALLGIPAEADLVKCGDLEARFDADGNPVRIQSGSGGSQRVWLEGNPTLTVSNETTGVSDIPIGGKLKSLDLAVSSKWSSNRFGLVWDLSFEGSGKRTGHEVTLDFPVLSPELRIFTPSNDPEVQVSARPTYRPVPYGSNAWDTGSAYVLPLITLQDPKTDQALTLALPPNVNIPHLQFEWIGGRVLRLTLAHRGMGEGKASRLRLLFYSHAADYRGALKAYSDEFPEYFEPPLPRGHAEGTFWYHHIQEHPAYAEMARQHVRYVWASFWFKYLGDYMPDGPEWAPYTYARWWKLGQMMSDEKINAFIAEMKQHGIGIFAYFNVTEYGGAGGVDGSAAAAHLLKTKFADSLVKDVQGREIPTWEDARAINPRQDGPIWPELKRQCERHFARLPEFEGFIFDRLDWASQYDYGHDDGFTTIGDRPVENLAQPVAAAVQSICRMAHAQHKRVFVNQFYRVEVLRDVDGYCHENDYVPALSYLAPFRPASAWEMRKDYQGDLLEFEKQMKLRLQCAVFPQMIAHEFPISQQKPNPHAADLLELYAPLFEPLIGKRQVLLPHCVAATGANDVNLFLNGAGAYVAPLTSRTRHRSRGAEQVEEVTITLKTPDAGEIRSAEVFSADGPAYPAKVSASRGMATVTVPKHCTASVVVASK
ncbi:MAG: hypothetical protein ACLQVL_35685 [Terriglobia bacterium]